MRRPVARRVSQPPSVNFSEVVTQRIVRQRKRPVMWTGRWRFQVGSARFVIQNLDMPSSESENVRKTLIEYMTTSALTLPRTQTSASAAAPPIMRTPFAVVSRSESDPKRCGNHESRAMFAMTRGPSMNPACAATKRRSVSERSVITMNHFPIGSPPGWKFPATSSTRTAFMVFSSSSVPSLISVLGTSSSVPSFVLSL